MENPTLGLLPRSTLIHTRSRSNAEGPNFSAASILARLIEGEAGPGTLSEALALSDGDLRAALARTSGAERRVAAQGLRPAELEEILQLSRERDPQLFFEGLLALGQRLEARDGLEAAARVYTILQHSLDAEGVPSGASPGWRSSLRSRAEGQLQAMRGEGAAGARFEFLSRRLAAQAADPAMLFGMTAAGMAFRLSRVAMLSRLLSTPTASVLSRGFLPRALAYSGGLLTESVVFTAGVRAGNATLGRTQDWSLRSVSHEWASGAITLLGLRATSALSRGAVQRLGSGNSLSLGVTRALVPQIGMLGGILLSHRLEAQLGLRSHPVNGTEWTDAFATLLQFNVAGRLSQGLMGSRWSSFERGLDIQAEALTRRVPLLPGSPGNFGFPSHLALAGAGFGRSAVRPPVRESLAELMNKPLLMSSDHNDSKGPRDRILGRPIGETPTANDAPTVSEPLMSREQFQGLWRTLQMTPDAEMRRNLVVAMLSEATRSPEAISFLMAVRDAQDKFQGRREVLQQIEEGLRDLDVSALEEFAHGNPYALRSLLELGKVSNARALGALQEMNFSSYAEMVTGDANLLVQIASPLRYAFDGGNKTAADLLRGLGEPAIEGLTRELESAISSGLMSQAAKATQLLSAIGRSGGNNSLVALRQLREFPVERYENAEIEDFTIHSIYLMAQAGNANAAELLSGIELYSVNPGSSALLLKLYRYGSQESFQDIKELAERGDLGAVSILRDLASTGHRAAGEFLQGMDPSSVYRQVESSDKALFYLALIAEYRNMKALHAISRNTSLTGRIERLVTQDPYSLISVVTPEMMLEQHCAVVSGFGELPQATRASIARDIVLAWQAESNKEAYYQDNPSRMVTEDLIPRSFFEPRAQAAVEGYERAGREAPPPRRSETRPSDRPGAKKSKRFVN